MYKYDAVGSYEKIRATAAGKAEKLIQPLLDELTAVEQDDSLWRLSSDQSRFESSAHRPGQATSHESVFSVLDKSSSQVLADPDLACQFLVDVFRAAREKEPSLGDNLTIQILTSRYPGHSSTRFRSDRRMYSLKSGEQLHPGSSLAAKSH